MNDDGSVECIAGATGYVGGTLARRLLGEGRRVRAIARRPERATELAGLGAEVVKADVLEPDSLAPVLEGARVAHYLVHSMGRGSDGDFVARDRRGARNFANAAREAGVERIVYLGGLGDVGSSKHLRSRHETAGELASSGIDLTYVRAAAVLGAGSESFRTMLHLVKRLPAMITPRWTTVSTQPIAIDDVVEYLALAASVEASRGRTIEVGGPDVTTYGGMMDEVARALGLRPRPTIGVPLLTPWLSSQWIGLVTPVDAGVAKPLVEGLSTETIVNDPSGMALFEIEPTPMATAMRNAVAKAREAGEL